MWEHQKFNVNALLMSNSRLSIYIVRSVSKHDYLMLTRILPHTIKSFGIVPLWYQNGFILYKWSIKQTFTHAWLRFTTLTVVAKRLREGSSFRYDKMIGADRGFFVQLSWYSFWWDKHVRMRETVHGNRNKVKTESRVQNISHIRSKSHL